MRVKTYRTKGMLSVTDMWRVVHDMHFEFNSSAEAAGSRYMAAECLDETYRGVVQGFVQELRDFADDMEESVNCADDNERRRQKNRENASSGSAARSTPASGLTA